MGKYGYLGLPEQSCVPMVASEIPPEGSDAGRVWGKRAGMRLYPFPACFGSSECAEETHLQEVTWCGLSPSTPKNPHKPKPRLGMER